MIRLVLIILGALAITACGNGGSVIFTPDPSNGGNLDSGVSAYTMTPGAVARATSAGGYSAKIQLSPQGGRVFSSAGGYTFVKR